MASTIMESFFQRTLEDLVKGLRVQMIGEGRYIANALAEIRKEIKSTDAHTKTVALQKLTYINMLQGVDMEWAAFHVVEVMSMAKFAHKKVGYLAASQSFHEGIDVLLLITNQLRKDLGSTNEYEAGLALECLSRIATPDLARDLTPEVFTLLGSSRLFARKKATLVLLKLFSKYPDAVRIAFKRLVEKMEDPDPQVVCAAVSVLCEMAVKDPRSYLPLAPEFYRLLVDSTNNWLSIKVVKIFGALAPLEPRLGRKIAEPLCEHMRRTGAKSLLLECIRTVIAGLTDHAGAVKLAVEKLKELLEGDDPNLKYLGLQALATLMPVHPWAVGEHKAIIVKSLSDGELSIQMASLRLIMGMVSESNVIETVQVVMQYAKKSDPSFCNELIGAVLATCSRGLYELVTDFTWYVSVLGDIARIPLCTHGKELERQFIDIGIRVQEVRGDLVTVARGILLDPTLLGHTYLHRVLSALAWIAGEYVELSQNPYELIEALLQPRSKLLPHPVRAVYLQAVLKVFVYFAFQCLEDSNEPPVAEVLAGTFSSLDLKAEVKSKHGIQLDNDLESTFDDNSKVEVSPQVLGVDAALFPANECDSESISTSMRGMRQSSVTTTGECSSIATKQHAHVQQDSLDKIMELIDVNVGPLGQSVDVEVQERACNLLGVVKSLREYMVLSDESVSLSKDRQNESQRAFEMIKFLRGIFSQELGPVSVFAQGRVAVPDGLVLEENLDSLDAMFSDEEVSAEKGKGWNIGKSEVREWEDGPVFVQRNKEDVLQSGESASLLAQHRQRHGSYYLSTEKVAATPEEYPPPRIAQSDAPSTSAASEDITKLAEQSLLWTKPRRPKARPVVVRLDDADEISVQSLKSKKDLKDDFISSAIRDVLAGDKNKQSLKSTGPGVLENKDSLLHGASHRHHRRSHRQGRRQEASLKEQNSRMQTDGRPVLHTQDAQLLLVSVHETVEMDSGKPEKRIPSRHRHSKHTKGLPKDLNLVEGDDGSVGRQREIHSGGLKHQQSGRRSRQRMKSPVNLSPQTPVIPDFLL